MLKHNSDWNGIITMLKRYASKYPNEYYIYQQLAETYYIESIGQYQLAYQCAENAFNMEPDDDLNIYTYACSLYYVGRIEESFDLFSRITSKDIDAIAYGELGEGILYAKALINDSIYMMGVICQDKHQYKEAKELFMKHLANRRRGQYSDFTKKQVMTIIDCHGDFSDKICIEFDSIPSQTYIDSVNQKVDADKEKEYKRWLKHDEHRYTF